MSSRKFENEDVEKVFDTYPEKFQKPLLKIREWIFELADDSDVIGRLEETLKWGQPSYVTIETQSGSTIRLDRFGKESIAVFFHCKTTLVQTFRDFFGSEFEFSKNRAIVLNPEEPISEESLKFCLDMALTYHHQKGRLSRAGD